MGMSLFNGLTTVALMKVLADIFALFQYKWEQEEFDVLTRTTRISLHFQLKNHRVLRRAFSYSWRLYVILDPFLTPGHVIDLIYNSRAAA